MCNIENVYSPSKHSRQKISNTDLHYSTDKEHPKLTSNLVTRLAHNALGKKKSILM